MVEKMKYKWKDFEKIMSKKVDITAGRFYLMFGIIFVFMIAFNLIGNTYGYNNGYEQALEDIEKQSYANDVSSLIHSMTFVQASGYLGKELIIGALTHWIGFIIFFALVILLRVVIK